MKTRIYKFNFLFKRMMNKTALIAAVIIFMIGAGAKTASASDNGIIKMEVTDQDGDPAVAAIVTLLSGKEVIAQKKPDINSIVTFNEVLPGTYDVKVELTGCFPQLTTGLVVSANKTSYVNVKLKADVKMLGTIDITPAKQSLVQETMSTGIAITVDEIEKSAVKGGGMVALIVAFTPGILPTADGKDIYSRGSRSGSSEYIIDGEKVVGSFNVPSQSVQGVTVFTGGVPAAYGDFTGGLVQITTKSYLNGLQEKRMMYETIEKDMQDAQDYQDEQKQKIAEKKKDEQKNDEKKTDEPKKK